MSRVEILETVYVLEVETTIQSDINNVTIEQIDSKIIEVNTGTVNMVLASDIIGLDTYLNNFLDDYEIDCGTP